MGFHRPLYRKKHIDLGYRWPGQKKDVHLGLWYDKFCDRWTMEEDDEGLWVLEEGKKQSWMETVTVEPKDENGQMQKEVGNPSRIQEAVQRMQRLVEARSGCFIPMKTESRFVTGLGRSHPVENGFAWHPTLGTPYLPGSSVKGMVRAWANETGNASLAHRLLGPEPKAEGSEKRVGEWIFFDALPQGTVQLEMDIMTPHYGPYYANPEQNPPHDRHDPVPIPFLTVAKGQPFVFAIAPRRPGGQKEIYHRKILLKWLKEALKWFGAGAKTAVGYGRFKMDSQKLDEWKKKREQAEAERRRNRLPPIMREMVQDGYEDDAGRFMQSMNEKWLPRMEAETTPKEEQQQIAQYLIDWYQEYRSDQWKKPNPKNKKKIARIHAILCKEV